MSKRGRKLLLGVLLALCVQVYLLAQVVTPAPWQTGFHPVTAFDLDRPLLEKIMNQTTSRWQDRNGSSGIALHLPQPDGTSRPYLLWITEQMEEGLAAKFPSIQTYFGQDAIDPRRNIYLIISPLGVKILYFNHTGLQYTLEPVHDQLPTYHFVPVRRDEEVAHLIETCSAEMHAEDQRFNEVIPGAARRGETKMYRYRLALACTGEYGSYHGTTKEEVLIAMNELLLQVNAVFERELSIHFDLVTNNEHLIFLDPETDPYMTDEVEDLLETNKTICNYAIGYPNFDVGQVLTTKFGGQAQIGSVCNFSRKAKAFSGLAEPEGYYMGAIFAHELAHQLGAQHTQSNDCNRNLPTSYEPGSGSTLMAYAGICAPNVQALPDDYFHGNSLELMLTKAEQGLIFGCVPGSKTENFPPEVDAGPDLYVPIGTPFQLTGTGSDPNGDSLTYLWEQMDALSYEDTLSLFGPLFRSLPPTTSPSRTIGGTEDAWEQLPQYARTATFRFTAKDLHLGLGSMAYDEMTVHFIDSLGPLKVVRPGGQSDSWTVNEAQRIRWDVAGTDQEPINCEMVDILLSTDGGKQYHTILAESIPNNGSFQIDAPSIAAANCKIKVRCSDTPIFAVSTGIFAIIDPDATSPTDTMTVDTTIISPGDTIPDMPVDTTLNPPGDTIPDTPVDTTLNPPGDTIPDMPVDTTLNPPGDTIPDTPVDTTLNPPGDTIPDMPVDTTVNPPGDTIPDMPVDTTLNPPGDTIPDMPVDTTLNPQGDTIPDMPVDTTLNPPGDTIPDIPVDTTLNPPGDTIPDMPVDTTLNPPGDTIPDMPIDTTLNPPGDTIPTNPTDTVPTPPQDTVVIGNPPDQDGNSDPERDCPGCPDIVELMPNPTNGIIYWKAYVRESRFGKLQLLDGLGRILENRQLIPEAGSTTISWDLSPYPSGTYWFRWITREGVITKPVVLRR